jgi:hypothetical protein
MKNLIVILSGLVCFSNFGMLAQGSRAFQIDFINKLSRAISPQTMSEIKTCMVKTLDVAGAIGVLGINESAMSNNNNIQNELFRKMNDYWRDDLVSFEQCENFRGELKNINIAVNNANKFGIVVGIFAPFFLKKYTAVPAIIGTGAGLVISGSMINEWNKKIKQINYCLDHPLMNANDFLKKDYPLFNLGTKL